MNLGEQNIKRRRQIIVAIFGFLGLLFFIMFRWEIGDVLGMLWNILKALLKRRAIPAFTDVQKESWNVLIGFTLLWSYLGVFFFWLSAISWQSLLPVSNLREIYRTAFHFLLHTLGLHGPAVFIKDGKILQTKEDTRKGPGVVVVDFNSAVVLEDEVPPPGVQRAIDNMIHAVLRSFGLADPIETPEAKGPGIVFIRRRERIRGAVDLRKQFRLQPKVTAYTRDGIEVYANVWSIFTIGQDPALSAVQVCYDGDPRSENLRVVLLEELPPTSDQTEKVFRVKALVDELDREDRAEIHRFARVAELLERHVTEEKKLRNYGPLPRDKAENRDRQELPRFDAERVFAAVFSQARADRDRVLPWAELPTRVASAYFREILSQVNYDELYRIGEEQAPITRYKSRLRLAIRNNGLLSYRLIYPRNGVSLEVGKAYSESDLRVTDVNPLTNSKMLRDRGIRVIAAGFGDVMPVSEAVYRYRLESWRAPWQRETEVVSATKELEATRIRAKARAAAQRDLAASMGRIFQTYENSQEILVLRIFQALEGVASDPRTRQLLPNNAIDMMRSLQMWVMPNRQMGPGQMGEDRQGQGEME